jgi:hypothetical protein
MAGVNKSIGAGNRFTLYGVVGSNGSLIGSTLNGASAGALEGMLRLEGGRTFPTNIPEPETLVVSGDDQPLVQFQFEADGLVNGVFEVAVQDLAFEALIQGTKVQSLADLQIGVLQPADLAQPDMCLIIQRRAKKWSAGVRGVKAWEISMIPKATLIPLYTTIEQKAFQPYRYSYAASKSDNSPFGMTLTEANLGTTQTPFFIIHSENPVWIDIIQGNAATQAFTLTYTPKSNAKTIVVVGGVQKAETTHYTLTGTALNFVTAPGSAVYAHVFYEVDESVFG